MNPITTLGDFNSNSSIDKFLQQQKISLADNKRKISASTTASGASTDVQPLLFFPQNQPQCMKSSEKLAFIEQALSPYNSHQYKSQSAGRLSGMGNFESEYAKTVPLELQSPDGGMFFFQKQAHDQEQKKSCQVQDFLQKIEENEMEKMQKAKTNTKHPTKGIKQYDRVDTDKRVLLRNLVYDQGMSIKAASLKLKINYSTAKTILQLYRRSGRIERFPHQRSFQKHKDKTAQGNISPSCHHHHINIADKQENQDLHIKIQISKYQNNKSKNEKRKKIVKKTKTNLFKQSITKSGKKQQAPIYDFESMNQVTKERSNSQDMLSESSFCTNLLLDLSFQQQNRNTDNEDTRGSQVNYRVQQGENDRTFKIFQTEDFIPFFKSSNSIWKQIHC